MSPFAPPLILTLKLDQHAFEILDTLRTQYFPPERNIVPAHITLFHALPGDQRTLIEQTLRAVCAQTQPFEVTFPTPRSLGKGVAIEIVSPALIRVRSRLAAEWSAWLEAQDQQRYRPHVTIQNKVARDQAQQLFDHLRDAWQPLAAQAEALLLWQYRGGPWEAAGTFPFGKQQA